MAAVAQQAYQAQSYGQHYHVNGQSVMQDVSDEDDEDDSMRGDPELDDDGDLTMTPDQMHFYQQQQQQALYYQQHTQQHGTNENAAGPSRRSSTHESASGQGVEEDEEVYSDDESSTASIPDDNIDFSLTYALHTFLATVEGQASVVKGDSLLLLDDANSYWWLVRVLKTEDVGYIPAENIETPYERLARLNKHRNVDLAAATQQEKQAGTVQGRERLKNAISGKAKSVRQAKAGEEDASGSRRVEFAPPTYVEHPGVTWSSDEEDEEDEGDVDLEEVERSQDDIRPDGDDLQNEREVSRVEDSLVRGGSGIDMEPDDGVEWADGAGQNEQKRVLDQKQSGMRSPPPPANAVIPKSNNPFAPRNQPTLGQVVETTYPSTTNSVSSLASSQPGGSPVLDPAQAQETRRITATPQVAQGSGGPLLPSAALSNANGARNVSGQSIGSVTSVVSSTSTRSTTPTSPSSEDKTLKKTRSKGSKEDLVGDGKKKSRGMLGGLFSRKSKDKDKKGISSIDPRSSEESMISGAMDSSPASQGRLSNDQHGPPGIVVSPPMSTHGARMAQREQATQQSYANKYLSRSQSGDLRSPSTAEAAAAVAQSAAAMRLAAGMNGDSKARPSSIILSPNPAGPPLLNVMRVFAGDHIRSEASFKTVLLNETTVASDLIRQAIQRFHLHHGSRSSSEENYFLTVKDVSGEETELAAMEKPLAVFQETVQRYADDQSAAKTDAIKTVKRSSVSSISSVMSLSNHPAIAKLGMNDYSDDSTVKLYLNRRRPHSQQANGGMPEPNSEFSSYSTQLSTVQESVSESASWDASSNATETLTASPPTPQAQPRYNPSLTISTNGQASPERFSSPSARFTVQLRIHPADLPDGLVFDPSSDAIIPRNVLRERQMNNQSASMPDFRRRLLVMPRNATVVEAIEQALDKFGIQEGVVDGGDDVEDRAGKRRSQAKVRYTLSAVSNGQERRLFASGKLLEAYSTPPNLRPLDRTTPEQRRRSRDMSGGQSTASAADLLPSDPVFVLRRVIPRPLSTGRREPLDDLALAQKSAGVLQKQQAVPSLANGSIPEASRGALSPQEIIAAQRAASRANQKALISANANQQQGVDIHLPARGTFRSSRIIGSGEMRYSFIDDGGETYDISELLEEEWGPDGSKSSPEILQQPPPLLRAPTDQSLYVTAPSTPDETGEPSTRKRSGSSASVDILQTAIERSAGKPNEKLEEKLQRVINKVKSSSGSTGPPRPESSETLASSSTSGRSTPPTGRSTPLARDRELSTLPEDNVADMTPRPERPDRSVARGFPPSASSSFVSTTSNGSDYQHTAASVNRIITRHRQQPSIASIMSDMSGPSPHWQADDDRSSTPVTATSSTHPTPPLFGAVFTRSVSAASPTPKAPVVYTDDFGIKAMMAVIQARAREEQGGWRPRSKATRGSSDLLAVKSEQHEAPDDGDQVDEVQRTLYGERLDMADVYPDFRPIIGGLQSRLDGLDRDIDDLLASLAVKQEADE